MNMRLYSITGRLMTKKVDDYLIEWDKPSRSKIQFKIKQFLKTVWRYHILYEEFPVYGSKMKVDFLNATKKIAIEVNGAQHKEFNKFFHNNSRANYLSSIKRDWAKTEWLERNGYTLIEIEQDEVDDVSVDFIKKKFNISII